MVLEPAVLGHAGLAQEGVAFGLEIGLQRSRELVVLYPVIADVGREVVLNITERQGLQRLVHVRMAGQQDGVGIALFLGLERRDDHAAAGPQLGVELGQRLVVVAHEVNQINGQDDIVAVAGQIVPNPIGTLEIQPGGLIPGSALRLGHGGL